MGIIDLDHIFFMEILKRSVDLHMLAHQGLHGGGNKEILLLQTQGLPFHMLVIGIQNLGNRLCHGLFFRGTDILARGKQRHIQRTGRTGLPQPQGIHMVSAVAGDLHITGNGNHGIVIFMHHMQMAVMPHFAKLSSEAHLFALFRFGNQPCSTHCFPVVGQFHLLAVHDALFKNAEFIAQRIASGRNPQRGHGVEIAGGQAAQAAVSETRVRFHFKNIRALKAHVFNGAVHRLQNAQIIGIFHQAAAHQKLQREIMHPALVGTLHAVHGFCAVQRHHIPQDQRAGFEQIFLVDIFF